MKNKLEWYKKNINVVERVENIVRKRETLKYWLSYELIQSY